MTNRRIKVALRLLEIVMQCLFFVTLNIIVSYLLLKYNVSEYNRCLMISVLVIAAYLFRQYIHSFFTFYLLHVFLFVAAVFYARSANECFLYILQVGILVAFSGHIKVATMRVTEEKMSLVGMAVMVVCYMLGLGTHNTVMIQSGLLILVLFTLAEIIYNNLDKINNVFIDNKENADFPAKQLFRVNMDMLATSVIIVFMAMMAFYSGPFGNIFQMIGRFLQWIIASILKLLLYRKPLEQSVLPTFSVETIGDSSEDKAEGMDPPISGSFDQLFYALLIMLIIFITIVLIIKIVKEMKNFSKKKKLGADMIEFIKPKKNATSKIKISRVNHKNEESEFDHNLKLRKIYKKKVKKGLGKEKLPTNAFPEEITRKGISVDEKNIKIVTEIYEKARYSNEKVNAEEIEIIKNINNT